MPEASILEAQIASLRGRLSGLLPLLLRHRRDIMAAVVGVAAVAAIMINGLMLQSGRHPAPIFAIRPLPVLARDTTGATTQMPRPRPPAVELAKPDPAHKPQPVPLPRPRAPFPQPSQSAQAAPRRDPIADIIDASRQLTAIQHALNDFGYGPIKVSGTLDQETRGGIERFERERNLTITGKNSAQLRHALSLATGRALD